MMANLFILKFPNRNSSSRIITASASSNGSSLSFSFIHSLIGYFFDDEMAGAPPLSSGTGAGTGSGPVILELPLEKIRRPLMRTRANDPIKVEELMDSIQQIGLQVPIDVLEVDGIYYGFSGCHRYEAHQRLGLPTIRCKIRRGTKETLRHHMR